PHCHRPPQALPPFPTRRSSDLIAELLPARQAQASLYAFDLVERRVKRGVGVPKAEPRRIRKVGIVGAGLMATQIASLFLRRLERSEEHTSELQSRGHLVCRLLL